MKYQNQILTGLIIIVSLIVACKKKVTEPDIPQHTSYAWQTAAPESLQVDGEQLVKAYAEADRMNFVEGLVIIRHGQLIGEQYYNGYTKNTPHNVRSVAKSFLSALIGIAIEQGLIEGLDTKIMPYFEVYDNDHMDRRWKDVTIRHLLTMQSGIDSDENILLDVQNSKDWVYTTLNQQLIFDPGTRFGYSTLGTHLLSVILTAASGKTSKQYAQENLFEPLGIEIGGWDLDPRGFYFGGSDMFFSPRDMARLGQLYLEGGNLDGKQIVAPHWVVASQTNQSRSQDSSWGQLDKIGYGFLWWLGEIDGYVVTVALGYGGQFIILLPKLETILVVTSEAYVSTWNAADVQERTVLEWVSKWVLPAFEIK